MGFHYILNPPRSSRLTEQVCLYSPNEACGTDYLRFFCNFKKFTLSFKVSKGAKIRNRYNQAPHMIQDTNGKVTNSQNESQEVSPFPAGDHKAHINRRAQRHSKHKTEKKPIKDPQKKYRLGTVSKICYWRA